MKLLREAQHSLDEFVQMYTSKTIAQPETNTTEEIITSTPNHTTHNDSSQPLDADEWEQESLTLDPDDIAELSACESLGGFLHAAGSSEPGEDEATTRTRIPCNSLSVDIEDVDGGRVDALMSEVDLSSFQEKKSDTTDLVIESVQCEERGGEGGWGSGTEEGMEGAVEGLEDSLKEFDDLIEEFKSPDEFLSQVNCH